MSPVPWTRAAVVLALQGAVTVSPPPPSAVAPRTLEEALAALEKALPEKTMQDLRESSDERLVNEYHHGLGTWVRNEWGLWRGGPLRDHFHALGLTHPDDMSSVILTSFWRRLHNQPLRVEEQIKHHQDYWRAALPPDKSSNPKCPSGIDITMSWNPPATTGGFRSVHMGKCCPDGVVWSYEVDRAGLAHLRQI